MGLRESGVVGSDVGRRAVARHAPFSRTPPARLSIGLCSGATALWLDSCCRDIRDRASETLVAQRSREQLIDLLAAAAERVGLPARHRGVAAHLAVVLENRDGVLVRACVANREGCVRGGPCRASTEVQYTPRGE